MPQVDGRLRHDRRRLPSLLVVVLALVVIGCAGAPSPSPSPEPAATPTATAQPGATATATPPSTAPATQPTEPSPSPTVEATPTAEPTPRITVDSAAQAAALVLASDEVFHGISEPQLELAGQCCWYQAHEAVGHYLVTIEVGWGDCQAGCIWTHRWLYQVDHDGTLTLREQEGDEPVERETPAGPGNGTVAIVALAGPICPVEPFPPDPACAPRPVADAQMTVLDPRGVEVQRAMTDAQGRLVLELPAGAYFVEPADVDGLMGTPQAQAFSIGGGGRVPVRLDYDTGIR
jgi:hypothetical protein